MFVSILFRSKERTILGKNWFIEETGGYLLLVRNFVYLLKRLPRNQHTDKLICTCAVNASMCKHDWAHPTHMGTRAGLDFTAIQQGDVNTPFPLSFNGNSRLGWKNPLGILSFSPPAPVGWMFVASQTQNKIKQKERLFLSKVTAWGKKKKTQRNSYQKTYVIDMCPIMQAYCKVVRVLSKSWFPGGTFDIQWPCHTPGIGAQTSLSLLLTWSPSLL